MRNIALTLLIITTSTTYSQVSTHSSDYSPIRRMVSISSLPEIEEDPDIQAKFHLQQWSDGVVFFKDSSQEMRRPLIFDVYNNTVYYLENGQIMEYIKPVHQFYMTVKQKKTAACFYFETTTPL